MFFKTLVGDLVDKNFLQRGARDKDKHVNFPQKYHECYVASLLLNLQANHIETSRWLLAG